jgi:O-antigen/teichoic acid export membrane protein
VSVVLDGRVAAPAMRNVSYLTAAQAATTLLHLSAFAVIAAHLGPSRFGVYVFAIAVPDLLQPFADFGFKTSVTRDVAQHPAREPWLVPNLLYLRALSAAICYGGAAVVLPLAGYHAASVRAGLAAAALVGVVALQSFQVVLEVRLRLGWVALANLAEGVFLVGGVAVLARAHAGVLSFVWLYVGANALALSVITVRALGAARLEWRPRPQRWWPLVRVAAPLGAAAVVTGLYYRLGVFILARMQSSAAVGQYGAGYRFIDTVGVFPGLLMTVLNPVLARSWAAGRDVLARRYRTIAQLIVLPGIWVTVGGTMAAWRIVPHLHSFRAYRGAGVTLAVLTPAAGLILIGTVLSGVLYNAHLQALLLRIAVGVLAVNVILDVALIPGLSYTGAAVATTVGELVSTVLLAGAVRRRLRLSWPWARLIRAAGAGALTALVMAAGYLVSPVVQVALGVLVFPLAALAFRAVTVADVSNLISWRRSDAPG